LFFFLLFSSRGGWLRDERGEGPEQGDRGLGRFAVHLIRSIRAVGTAVAHLIHQHLGVSRSACEHFLCWLHSAKYLILPMGAVPLPVASLLSIHTLAALPAQESTRTAHIASPLVTAVVAVRLAVAS
ncbi:hypothetical protein PENTCL1PPCAC_3904, partial [Pristionchus entomophagus]